MPNILITGASKGIGLESAKLFKQNGYAVIVIVRDSESFKMFENKGYETYLADVTEYTKIDHIFEQLQKNHSHLDIVFNNAGFGQPGALEDVSVEVLKEQFETNFFALHYITQKAIKMMRSKGSGKIIQHSSVLGLISLKFRGAYNASKYAIEGLCDTLRLELLDTDIKVITLNTGPVISNFRNKALQMFQKNIDIQKSVYKKEYETALCQRLEAKDNPPFTLTSKEAAQIVFTIAQSKRVKPRYYITKATYILGALKRLLSTKLLDKVLVRI